MGDCEIEGASQFAADPIQRIEAFATAVVVPQHLTNNDFGIRINVQLAGLEVHRALKSLEKSEIFGDVVVLIADPLGDSDAP